MRELLTNDYVLHFIGAPLLGAICMSPFVYLHEKTEKKDTSFPQAFGGIFALLVLAAFVAAITGITDIWW